MIPTKALLALVLTTGAAFADASMHDRVTIGDANYEAELAQSGVIIGAALYGTSDADYDAFLTPARFFEMHALGQHDAGYEVILAGRGQLVGAPLFGDYDADYAVLMNDDFFETAALGSYDADYEAVLAFRKAPGVDAFLEDFAALD